MSSDRGGRRLAGRLRASGDEAPRLRLRQAVVTDVAGSTVSLNLGGDTSVTLTGIPYLSTGISPDIGDTVWLLQQGPLLVVLGKLA